MKRTITPKIEGHFTSLLARIGEAVEVPFEPIFGDWQPRLAERHANTDKWVAQNPTLKAVREWLRWGEDEHGTCLLIAHSVIDDGGKLFDITPIHPNTPRPKFLIDHGTKEAFDAAQPKWSSGF